MTNKKTALEELKQIVEEAKLLLELAQRADSIESRLEALEAKHQWKYGTDGSMTSPECFGYPLPEVGYGSNDSRTIELPDDAFKAIERIIEDSHSHSNVVNDLVGWFNPDTVKIGSVTFIRAKKENK